MSRAAGGAEKRPYLRDPDRRRQLLGVAADIVRSQGWGGLTMAGVASMAGVSRQLVYSHFSALAGLTSALLVDRFSGLERAVGEAIERHPGDVVGAIGDAAGQVLDLPAEDRRVLWALVTEAGPRSAEIEQVTAQLRSRMVGRWIRTDTGRSGGMQFTVPAVFWAITSAIFGLAELVDAGSIRAEEATAIVTAMATGCRDAPRVRRRRPPPGARPGPADSEPPPRPASIEQ